MFTSHLSQVFVLTEELFGVIALHCEICRGQCVFVTQDIEDIAGQAALVQLSPSTDVNCYIEECIAISSIGVSQFPEEVSQIHIDEFNGNPELNSIVKWLLIFRIIPWS